MIQTIRRIYLYAVTFVSLETVLWGTIGLARSFFSGDVPDESSEMLARALSLILVGVPVFVIHGWLAQRSSLRDEGERFAGVRAVFVYGTLLATLIPIAQNVLTVVNRVALDTFRISARPTMFGGEQSLSDNLIAILINAVAASAIFYFARMDWKAGPKGESYADVRRLYRYIWLVYSLGMVVFGLQQVLYFSLTVWRPDKAEAWNALANGLALLLVGAPLLTLVERLLNRSLAEPPEKDSVLRLVVLSLVVFLSACVSLISAIFLLEVLLDAAYTLLFGEGLSPLVEFLGGIAGPLSAMLPFGAAWVYYARRLGLKTRTSTAAEKGSQPEEYRHTGLQSLYSYALALFGIGASFIGVHQLLGFLLEKVLGGAALAESGNVEMLTISMANLLVGIPVWVVAWFPMQAEALQAGNGGEIARRSTVRRGYLYLMLFTSVVGLMAGTGALLYRVLLSLLGEASSDLLLESLQHTKTTLLFAGLSIYHWRMLRGDGRRSEEVLSKRHTKFPLLILAPDEGEFVTPLVEALRRVAPELPVAVHPYSQGAPDETLSTARAVILPAELIARPSEAMRLWLQTFDGARIVLFSPIEGWFWLFDSSGSYSKITRRAAQTIRRMAEGEELR